LDLYWLGTGLLYGSLMAFPLLLYMLVFHPSPLSTYYTSLLLLAGPILSFFTFLNWLGLKYFRQNA
jgi:hypothetical protein